MDVLQKALTMLTKYPLCDSCLGRQFAQLGYSMENSSRGQALKLSLTLQYSALNQGNSKETVSNLKTLAINGFSHEAEETIRHMGKRFIKKVEKICFLCEGRLQTIELLAKTAIEKIEGIEYTTFLVGVELPVKVEEREDEFKAEFGASYSECIRHEFGRLLGKKIADLTGKNVDYRKPDVAFVVRPFEEDVAIHVNPLFIAGRYRKLVRDMPQSKWFCTSCRGRGCERCGGTGKLYPESVEEIVSKPIMEAAFGEKTAFHASGREDIDARMLGSGRPFVVEVSKPRTRFLDLEKIGNAINESGRGKVEVSNLRFTNKDVVRKLKKAESAQKEYRVLIEFENEVQDEALFLLEEKLSNSLIKQRTPLRVLHRRADLVREKYIYKLKVKKVSPKKAELEIRCQGGLYVKELVSGDEGRTTPSVSEMLKNKAKPVKLDVLNVIIEDQ